MNGLKLRPNPLSILFLLPLVPSGTSATAAVAARVLGGRQRGSAPAKFEGASSILDWEFTGTEVSSELQAETYRGDDMEAFPSCDDHGGRSFGS